LNTKERWLKDNRIIGKWVLNWISNCLCLYSYRKYSQKLLLKEEMSSCNVEALTIAKRFLNRFHLLFNPIILPSHNLCSVDFYLQISFSPALLPSSSLCLLSSSWKSIRIWACMSLRSCTFSDETSFPKRRSLLQVSNPQSFGCPELVFVEFFLLYQLFYIGILLSFISQFIILLSFTFYQTFYLSSLLSGAWTEIENYSKPDL